MASLMAARSTTAGTPLFNRSVKKILKFETAINFIIDFCRRGRNATAHRAPVVLCGSQGAVSACKASWPVRYPSRSIMECYLREVLEDDSGRLEGDVSIDLGVLLPVEDGLNVVGLDVELVAVSDGGLEQHSDGVRKGL